MMGVKAAADLEGCDRGPRERRGSQGYNNFRDFGEYVRHSNFSVIRD